MARGRSVRTCSWIAIVLALGAMGPGCGGAPAPEPETASGASPSETEESQAPPAETTSTAGADTAGPSADMQQYASRVMAMVRQHWTIPAVLSPTESRTLEASIEIMMDEATRLPTDYRIVEASGNEIFDASVHEGLRALVRAQAPMPEPPAGLDDRRSVRLRLRGR